MKEFIFVLPLSWIITHSQVAAAVAAAAGQPRIMNGSPADVGQFPYQAYISDDLTAACGASIIHKRWLLTAAHCRPYVSKQAYAIVGTVYRNGFNGTRYSFEKFIQHHEFGMSNISSLTLLKRKSKVVNDIALIRVTEDIKFTNYVQPIKLARDEWNDYANISAMLSGWGIKGIRGRAPKELQYASLQVISEKECGKLWRMKITNEICTAGSIYQPTRASACIGDSGGPLAYKGKQIGVVSYGQGRCGIYLPDVYTKVSSHVSWIEEQLQLYSDKLPL